jgi:hypothetical protein
VPCLKRSTKYFEVSGEKELAPGLKRIRKSFREEMQRQKEWLVVKSKSEVCYQ